MTTRDEKIEKAAKRFYGLAFPEGDLFAHTAHPAKPLILAAFRLYENSWHPFDIGRWEWPFTALAAARPSEEFDGKDPWTVLFRAALALREPQRYMLDYLAPYVAPDDIGLPLAEFRGLVAGRIRDDLAARQLDAAQPATAKARLMVCRTCGSIHVKRDAWAAWSVAGQCWELLDTFDHAICSGRCGGGEARIIEIACEPGDAAAYIAYVGDFEEEHDGEQALPYGDWRAAQLAAEGQRQSAIVATVELHRDRVLSAEQARLILAGLAASADTLRTLAHGREG